MTTAEMKWSPGQQRALELAQTWLEFAEPRHGYSAETEEREGVAPGSTPVFRLFGYAGTGKTQLARHLAAGRQGMVSFAAYTGKAAMVMRQRGITDAGTLHSLIYTPREKSEARLEELKEELEKAQLAALQGEESKRPITEIERDLEKEKHELRSPSFELNFESSPLAGASLLVVDEVSMVGDELAQDLLSFGVPIMVLGDPFQLPPVKGSGYFTEHAPDAMLTEVHRQAEGSPVIRLATQIRTERRLPMDQEQVRRRENFTATDMLAYDQVIVGRNATRKVLNADMRRALGLAGLLPVASDRLICLKNNRKRGIFNGQQFMVKAARHDGENVIHLDVLSEDGREIEDLPVYRHHFEGREAELPLPNRKVAEEMDFAYAITCHKSQGSQWPSVLIVDESRCFREDAARWLYTAVTRAAEKVMVLA